VEQELFIQVSEVSWRFIHIFSNTVENWYCCKAVTARVPEAELCGESKSDAERQHQQLLVSLGSCRSLAAPAFNKSGGALKQNPCRLQGG